MVHELKSLPVVPVNARGTAVLILLFAAAIVVLHEAEAFFVPIFLSILLAYALEPAVLALIHARCPRFAAATLVYLLIACIAIGSGRIVRARASQFLDDLPRTIAAVKAEIGAQAADPEPDSLDQLQTAAGELQKALPAAAGARAARRVVAVGPAFDLRQYVLPASVTATTIGVRFGIVAVLTFLLLITGDLYKRKLMELAGPDRADRRLTAAVINTIDRQIERFLVVRVLISVIVGTATGGGVWWVGLEHAFVWGVIAGVLNVAPFIGPTIAVAMITLAAFLQFHAIEPTMLAGAIAAAIAALEGNLISPWLQGRAGELNTVAVFVSVLFWGWVWGIWGLLLAVPIMVAVKAAADHIEPLQPVAELLGR